MPPCSATWHWIWPLLRSRLQLNFCSARRDVEHCSQKKSLTLSLARSELSQYSRLCLALWLGLQGKDDIRYANNMFSPQLVNCWGNKANASAMWLTFWFNNCNNKIIKSTGDSEGESALEYRHPVILFVLSFHYTRCLLNKGHGQMWASNKQ